jgi:tRNA threonylcarbamoyl adenosine modification protein YeaZ
MTTTLAIETSTHQGSLALLHRGEMIFSESCGAGRSHSSLLFAVLERALKALPEGSRIDLIAVGLGPGSYAGVRIAIAAATGFAIATGAKLVGLPSIVALSEGDYVALGDARRQSYYYARVSAGECVEGPTLFTAGQLSEKLSGNPLPILASEEIAGLEPAPAIQLAYPSAERLARLAARGSSIGARGNLEPIYLRDPHITVSKKIAE